MSDAPGPIVLLAQEAPSTRFIYNRLKVEFRDVRVIVEEPAGKVALLRRRARTIGLPTVAGQALFGLVVPLLRSRGRARIAEIKDGYKLDDRPIGRPHLRVRSVNDEATLGALATWAPTVVVLSGTRILSRRTLEAMPCPVVNVHAGITPLYRGVHGGYWALVEGRPDLVGTTIHFVDPGIDTGQIVRHIAFRPTEHDNFATYPYLHVAVALDDLVEVLRDLIAGRDLPAIDPPLPSRLRTHPTLWQYVLHRVREGIR